MFVVATLILADTAAPQPISARLSPRATCEDVTVVESFPEVVSGTCLDELASTTLVVRNSSSLYLGLGVEKQPRTLSLRRSDLFGPLGIVAPRGLARYETEFPKSGAVVLVQPRLFTKRAVATNLVSVALELVGVKLATGAWKEWSDVLEIVLSSEDFGLALACFVGSSAAQNTFIGLMQAIDCARDPLANFAKRSDLVRKLASAVSKLAGQVLGAQLVAGAISTVVVGYRAVKLGKRFWSLGKVVAAGDALDVSFRVNRGGVRPVLIPGEETQIGVFAPSEKGDLPQDVAVARTVRGNCFYGSPVAERPDAWRCNSSSILDPCFELPARKGVLACYASPWVRSVTLVRLTAPLRELVRNEDLVPSLRDPWAVELANGDRCVFLEGAPLQVGRELFHGRCDRGFASLRIDRGRALWRIPYLSGVRDRTPQFASVTVAWV